MSELIAAFISELIRAANEVDRLSPPERARLLRRAAGTIRDYRDQIGEDAVADSADIVLELNSMAESIDLVGSSEVGAMILDAVAAIKAGRADLELGLNAEYEKLIDEMNGLQVGGKNERSEE